MRQSLLCYLLCTLFLVTACDPVKGPTSPTSPKPPEPKAAAQ